MEATVIMVLDDLAGVSNTSSVDCSDLTYELLTCADILQVGFIGLMDEIYYFNTTALTAGQIGTLRSFDNCSSFSASSTSNGSGNWDSSFTNTPTTTSDVLVQDSNDITIQDGLNAVTQDILVSETRFFKH